MIDTQQAKVVIFGGLAIFGLPTALLAVPTQGMNPLAWVALFVGIGAIALWAVMWTAIHAVGFVRNRQMAVD